MEEKNRVFTGLYAVNNLNGRKMPVYVGDFVLATVGTGNVVGVLSRLRDFEFAKAMKIPIIRVVVGPDSDTSPIGVRNKFRKSGTMVNSDFKWNGCPYSDFKSWILEEKGWGKGYCISSSRLAFRASAAGCPYSRIHCLKCGMCR